MCFSTDVNKSDRFPVITFHRASTGKTNKNMDCTVTPSRKPLTRASLQALLLREERDVTDDCVFWLEDCDQQTVNEALGLAGRLCFKRSGRTPDR